MYETHGKGEIRVVKQEPRTKQQTIVKSWRRGEYGRCESNDTKPYENRPLHMNAHASAPVCVELVTR